MVEVSEATQPGDEGTRRELRMTRVLPPSSPSGTSQASAPMTALQ